MLIVGFLLNVVFRVKDCLDVSSTHNIPVLKIPPKMTMVILKLFTIHIYDLACCLLVHLIRVDTFYIGSKPC